jgi:hypothetical protein
MVGRHPRFHLHFTPTSASWLNQVERFFGQITEDRIRRGAFHSVADLEASIESYLEQHNIDPKPFVWTAQTDKILEKVTRAKQALESQHIPPPRSCSECTTPKRSRSTIKGGRR